MKSLNRAGKLTVVYVASAILTFAAFLIVILGSWSFSQTLVAIVAMAVVQFVAQLVGFMGFGRDENGRWRFAMLIFMLLILAIIVAGSLWIMYHLNYNMMTPQETDRLMIQESDRGF